MGSIDISKALSTLLKVGPSINPSDIEKFQRHFLGECQESNPGLLGEKQECYLCATHPFRTYYLYRAKCYRIVRTIQDVKWQFGFCQVGQLAGVDAAVVGCRRGQVEEAADGAVADRRLHAEKNNGLWRSTVGSQAF